MKSGISLEHWLLGDFLGGEFLRRRNVGHLVLVVELGFLVVVKRHDHREDRVAVLDRGYPAGRIALAVAQPLDLVNNRNLRIAGQDEIAMQRMRQPALDGAARRHHRLSDHLSAEYPLPARLRAVAAEQVHLERLDIEDGDQVDDAFGHGVLSVELRRHSGAIRSIEPGISRFRVRHFVSSRNDDGGR